jgi:hypothetical protein
MAAMTPQGSGEVPPPSPPGAPEAQRQVRYNYLVGRLRGRQITMEEATELFAMMQALLRASEAARRTVPGAPGRAGPVTGAPRPLAGVAPVGSAPDDMFLVGLLAMGAGAGLLAAMSRRLAGGPRDGAGTEKGSTERRSG